MAWGLVPVGITEVLTALNLRVFAWNFNITRLVSIDMLSLPMLVATAMTTRTTLISLSLRSYIMSHD